jgi:pimeloyl-ACP methyl ester carboxylesterase
MRTAGDGEPILVLHDELGFPGWMSWNRELSQARRLLVPDQPGYGGTKRVPWVTDYRDLAAWYASRLRASGLGQIDAIGFSAGGFIAAEMLGIAPDVIRRLILVAPLGLKPTSGEIRDFLAMTTRSHVAATVSRIDAPEFGEIYGGQITPEQFGLLEDARSESARLGWEPFMHDPSLEGLLKLAPRRDVLILWGEEDLIVPRSCMERYQQCIKGAQLVTFPNVGHRPEIEDPNSFLSAVSEFLSSRSGDL